MILKKISKRACEILVIVRSLSALLASFFFVLHLPAQEALACKCIWKGPFLDVAGEAELIVFGKVAKHSSEKPVSLSFSFEVEKTYRGKKLSVLDVFGDDGMSCRPYVAKFPVGSSWILALKKSEDLHQGLGGYYLSSCGAYWVEVSEKQVKGSISGSATRDSIQTMSLMRIEKLLSSAHGKS